MGDVAYGGGSQLVNNATRDAFQTYLHGQVPVEALLVSISGAKGRVFLCCCVGVFSWRCKVPSHEFWKLFGLRRPRIESIQ